MEKTSTAYTASARRRKHLHARGENIERPFRLVSKGETPPRTWRKLAPASAPICAIRNTSTHVEKTVLACLGVDFREKHLHARGENLRMNSALLSFPETPPRTWRKRSASSGICSACRNTSTHVEKTRAGVVAVPNDKKHLHARGENFKSNKYHAIKRETPPRTWRKLVSKSIPHVSHRNTSTHVEKTQPNCPLKNAMRKHLHARGENSFQRRETATGEETPPRTWRKRQVTLALILLLRNTSTHVEKTLCTSSRNKVISKHLHARGENL